MKFETTHRYPVSADLLWALAPELYTLNDLTGMLVQYGGVSTKRPRTGMVYDYAVSVLGIFRNRHWRVEVTSMDEVRRRRVTTEHGAGVKRWDHVMTAIQDSHDPNVSILHEELTIEANRWWVTPFAVLFARVIYEKRHPPRLAALKDRDVANSIYMRYLEETGVAGRAV